MENEGRKAVILLSGGLDSTTLVAFAINARKFKPENILGLVMHYGQKHSKETRAAWDVIEYYGLHGKDIDLTEVFQGFDNPLLQNSKNELPAVGYFEQLKQQKGQPVPTYVPFRNGVFLSVATAHALDFGAEVVMYGAHADDAAGSAYPDCSRTFAASMDDAISAGTGNKVELEAPFVTYTKADIVRYGLLHKVPYDLTWSCYAGGVYACGKCGTCRDRLAAFEKNGAKDPIIYR